MKPWQRGLRCLFVSYFTLRLSGLRLCLDVGLILLEEEPDSLVHPPPPILQNLHQLLQPGCHAPAALGTLGDHDRQAEAVRRVI